MADNSSYRPSRAGSSSARGDTGSPDGGRAGGTDPLLELARLIGQDDGLKTIVRDSGRDVAKYDPAPHEDDRRTPSWLNDNGPAAPHRSDERDADEYDPRYVRPPVAAPHDAEPYETDARSGDVTVPEHDHDTGYYGDDDQMLDEGYDEAPPERRRAVVTIIAAVVGLAVVGTAGAFGYRAWSGGTGPAGEPPLIKADTAPSKIVPATQGENGSKFSYDRVGGQGPGSGGEKMASREERPVDVRPPTPRVILPGQPGVPPPTTGMIGGPATPALASVNSNEPKKVKTEVIKPDRVATADMSPPSGPLPTARPVQTTVIPTPAAVPPARNAAPAGTPKAAAPGPIALGARNGETGEPPVAPAGRNAPPAAGGFMVQVSAQQTEQEAQSSYRVMQTKYPTVLGNRQPVIQRADLGDKGVFFRAQVGPFGNRDLANQFCESLKTAGGKCLVRAN